MARTMRSGRRCSGVRSKAHKLIALCMGGVLLFSSGQAVANESREGFLRQNQEDAGSPSTMTGPEIAGQVATCTLSGAAAAGRGGSDSNNTLTLSKDYLNATVKCSGENNTFVPTEETKVCSVTGNTDTLADCKETVSGSNGRQTTLRHLLGASSDIVWKKISRSEDQGETRTLTLQESELPLSDKVFFVGCDQKSSPSKPESKTLSECKVIVNVKARTSSVDVNNVATCAYGQNSNPEPLKVEMTTEKNSVTLRCGSEGSLNPPAYTTKYCDPQESASSCTQKDFADILPTIAENWWTKDTKTNSVTLTIPVPDFSQSEQQFRLQCIHKANTQESSGAKVEDSNDVSQAPANTSTCNVIVTVKAGSSASSAGQMVATVSGAAALAGFLVGSL
ncbi:SAG-related sequence protein SRS15A [Toxoplasma gondii VAND]|uniref:SAG-related sequence protein SRS15A n=1 Tax=Toxoplasma gondii VAND TaxID=933077 RepID=A0A086PU93_TOXGO|nr:SAG-related sequence protein SRS15A [Toxoplasma gondii VAND]